MILLAFIFILVNINNIVLTPHKEHEYILESRLECKTNLQVPTYIMLGNITIKTEAYMTSSSKPSMLYLLYPPCDSK